MSEMRYLVSIVLILLLLAPNCFAEPTQLGGKMGRNILDTFANNSTNLTNSTNETDLWSWGKLPLGHFVNASSGKLAANPIADDGFVVIPPHSGTR
jgi:hypothetical protein